MPEIQLYLIPTPGAKPEFLATVETTSTVLPIRTSGSSSSNNKLILEGYTRDGWAWKPHPTLWQTIQLNPTTDTAQDDNQNKRSRDKLTGFVKYLKERQKCAYARLPATGGVLVISYIQPTKPHDEGSVTCRFTLDVTQIPNCTLRPTLHTSNDNKSQGESKRNISTGSSGSSGSSSRSATQQQQGHGSSAAVVAATVPSTAAAKRPSTTTTKKRSPGMLGNLLGAQQRTQSQMNEAAVHHAKKRQQTTSGHQQHDSPTSTASSSSSSATTATKTAQDILQTFRQTMNKKMLDFDLAGDDDNVLRVPLSLADMTSDLHDDGEKSRVTMDVLKYIVYEQAEEVNEDWVAVREPTEFMDEVVIAVYKEAPPEVLEQVNQADLPDEIKGQQRAIQEARHRAIAKQEAVEEQRLVQMMAAEEDDDLATLNVHKRDRRTIEEIQREMNDPKRPKLQES